MAHASTTKSAIITGASRGIGRAVAKRLARDGFAVVVNYVIIICVSPGPIDTPGFNGLAQSEEQAEQLKTNQVSTVPLGGWEVLMKSPKPSLSSRRMTAVMSPV